MRNIMTRSSLLERRPILSVREQIDAARDEASLFDFTKAFWPVVEPGPLVTNWHIEAICEHLEAVADRQVGRGLLINMPPRHMKSLSANVFFPAWVWAQDPNPDNDPDWTLQLQRDAWRGPGVKFMHLSYAAPLASRDSVKCRQIITHPTYQRLWGDRIHLQADQNQKTRFDNLQGGYRLSSSETGRITGEGGDIIVFDDPHNVHALSDANREATLLFWDEAMQSRLNDQQHGVFIVIMQRVHERDLSGHILATERGWTHLCLPAQYERNHPFPICTTVKRKATGEIWKDPRQENEPLWPARFPLESLDRIAKDQGMSSHVRAGQLQQRPTAREGGLFKRAWFANPVQFVLNRDRLRLVRGWDTASSVDATSDPDFSVGVLLGQDPELLFYYVLDVIRGRYSPADLERVIKQTAIMDGPNTRIVIPKEPGSQSGFFASYLAKQLAGFSVSMEREQGGDKAWRAEPFAAQCENGMARIVQALWNQSYVDELCAFPNGAHDDQVDATSAAFRALLRHSSISAVGA